MTELEQKKEEAIKQITKAEKAIYEYACFCEVGEERTKAFQVYENIRTATAVG